MNWFNNWKKRLFGSFTWYEILEYNLVMGMIRSTDEDWKWMDGMKWSGFKSWRTPRVYGVYSSTGKKDTNFVKLEFRSPLEVPKFVMLDNYPYSYRVKRRDNVVLIESSKLYRYLQRNKVIRILIQR